MATGINAEAQVTAPQDSTGGWPLTATYSLEAGAERAFNTYLSPLLQKGGSFAIDGSWTRGCAAPRHRLALSFGARYRMGFLRNPARNASMTDINLALQCDLQRSLKLPGTHPSLKLAAGAGLLVDGGILYLPGNSNNPVAARLYAGLTLNGTASYDIRVRGHLIRLIDEICMPTLGIFFSPHFGHSYYEIYLGEHSGLAHCGWWGNHFGIDNLVAAEIPVCSARLRLGYRLQITNSRASHIDSRITCHSFVLGITTDWLNITRRHE